MIGSSGAFSWVLLKFNLYLEKPALLILLFSISQAEVNVKIKKAYCPPQVVVGNPCLEYVKYIIFPWFNEFIVERKAENGGDK